MAAHQQALAKAILADPDVESLSSFIGVDGSNVTLNSGRLLINLKPHDERKATRERDHPAAAEGDRGRSGHLAVHAAGAGSHRSTPRSARPSISSLWRTRIWRRCRNGRRRSCSGSRRFPRSSTSRAICSRTALGARRSRPRQRGAVRHHAGHRRQRALRRLRPAHHLDHLHPDQPVPRHPRHRSEDGALAEFAELDLPAFGLLDLGPDAARVRSPISSSRPRRCRSPT